MTKVVKFGGSSLADAKQFKKVADIIHADPERVYVVPSAPGKRFKDDTKVTDLLYQCYERTITGEDFAKAFAPVRERYDGIIKDLNLDISLDDEYVKIGQDFRNSSRFFAAEIRNKPRCLKGHAAVMDLAKLSILRRLIICNVSYRYFSQFTIWLLI